MAISADQPLAHNLPPESGDGGELARPGLAEVVRVFARIGCINFGGPAGQIALMHRELVEERGWVEEAPFLRSLNFCHFLPGPEAQQLATFIGWRLAGVTGGLAAGLLFVLPGALVMLALSIFYVLAGQSLWFSGLFVGIKAAVLAIIMQAVLRIGGRALTSRTSRAIATAAFLALALFNLPFPLVILAAFIAGTLWLRGHGAAPAAAQTQGWLSAGEMADGLGLAESTPGPLIMVTQFVGFLGAYRLPAPFSPLIAGMLGALVTTWVTFAPCFLFIFSAAPWIERLEHARRFQAGLAGVTAAVVGVIANLALWFAVHFLFTRGSLLQVGPIRLHLPDPMSLNLPAVALAVIAFFIAFRLRWSTPLLLLAMSGAGLLARLTAG